MSGGRPWFRTLALVMGFAFLYVPIMFFQRAQDAESAGVHK